MTTKELTNEIQDATKISDILQEYTLGESDQSKIKAFMRASEMLKKYAFLLAGKVGGVKL